MELRFLQPRNVSQEDGTQLTRANIQVDTTMLLGQLTETQIANYYNALDAHYREVKAYIEHKQCMAQITQFLKKRDERIVEEDKARRAADQREQREKPTPQLADLMQW